MKKAKLLFALIGIISLIAVGSLVFNGDTIPGNQFFLPKEVGNDFIIDQQHNIIFTVNNGDGFNLMSYKNGRLDVLKSVNSCFQPFLLNNRINYLEDDGGSEDFKTSDIHLNKLIGQKAIRRIFSFDRSRLLVVQLSDDKAFVIHAGKNTITEITGVDHSFGAAYSNQNELLIISHMGYISTIDANSFRQRDYKLGKDYNISNLFVAGDTVLFSSNVETNFKCIYELNLKHIDAGVKLRLSGQHDLLMPKYYNHDLYYIEVVDHEYLLRCRNADGAVKKYTSDGVVYQYNIYKDTIVYSYAALNTPRSIYVQRLTDKRRTPVFLDRDENMEISSGLLVFDKDALPAFFLQTARTVKKRGVIIFIHPGIKTDYSPRYDVLINNLCNEGYDVVAPNFPSSTGEGKIYEELSPDAAAEDLLKLNAFLVQHFKCPVYLFSSSSGNVLMEKIILASHKITAAASLFGLPNNETQPREIPIPTLYFLGKNDPIVNYDERMRDMPSWFQRSQVSYIAYPKEGHWFRNKLNTQDALENIIKLFTQK